MRCMVSLWKRKKFWSVDDQEEVLNLLKWVLERDIACSVTVASNGYQALNLLHREEYDLVITDLNMPLMNGYELVKKAREAHGNAFPMIILSSEIGSLPDMRRFDVLLAKKPLDIRDFVSQAHLMFA